MSHCPPRPLEGQVCLVTGGSRGLGREMALALAEGGARVMITGRRESAALGAAAAALRAVAGDGNVAATVADVAAPDAGDTVVAETLRRFGRLDALVNNAGLGMREASETFNTDPVPFWQVPGDAWRRIMDANVGGAFAMARAAAPVMVAAGWGRIVNVSTSARTMVRRGYSPYGPSKAALEAASRIWAADLAGTGVTVNVYLPGGASDTDFIPGGPGRTGADGNLLPAGVMRRGIVWLCSPLSDGHTGGRYTARLWDEAAPLDGDAAAAARSPGADEPAIM